MRFLPARLTAPPFHLRLHVLLVLKQKENPIHYIMFTLPYISLKLEIMIITGVIPSVDSI